MARFVKFTDPQLQKCYDNNLAEAKDSPDQLRQIRALLSAHDLFQTLEGPHSSRVHEIMEHLLLPELRSWLRQWYQRSGGNLHPAAIGLRDQLSRLAGERLEIQTDISHNPP